MPRRQAFSKAKLNQAKKDNLKQQTLNSKFISSKSSNLKPNSASQSSSLAVSNPTSASQSPCRALKQLANFASTILETDFAKQGNPSQPALSALSSHKDFNNILSRLEKIAVNSNPTENFLQQAKIILAPFQSEPLKFSTTNYNKLLSLQEDSEARKVLSLCERPFRKLRPLYTITDGNCTFNAIVLFLNASPSPELVVKLRISVVAELAFHPSSYHTVLNEYCCSADADFIEAEIFSEMRAACRDGGWCGFVSFAALATVLGYPIRLVHPIYSVPTDSGFPFNPRVMNKTLYPVRGYTNFETIYILASGGSIDDLMENPGKWRFNHFVLLVDPLRTPSSSQQECSSVSSFLRHSSSSSAAAQETSLILPLPTITEHRSSTASLSNAFCPPSPSGVFDQNSTLNSSKNSSGSNASKQLNFQSCSYFTDSLSSPCIFYNLTPVTHLITDSNSSSPDAIQPVSASQESLQPGAFLLSGTQFMSTQAMFDILSRSDVANRAIQRIPSGPKSNCYFILHLGDELTDYTKLSSNRLKIQDRLRDGTGGWDDTYVSNACLFLVENGVLKSVVMNKKKNIIPSLFHLRAHRGTYVSQNSSGPPSKKSVFWFWNSEHSPAPGMAIISYLGPAFTPRPHGNS